MVQLREAVGMRNRYLVVAPDSMTHCGVGQCTRLHGFQESQVSSANTDLAMSEEEKESG
jgi:hypothetical protein